MNTVTDEIRLYLVPERLCLAPVKPNEVLVPARPGRWLQVGLSILSYRTGAARASRLRASSTSQAGGGRRSDRWGYGSIRSGSTKISGSATIEWKRYDGSQKIKFPREVEVRRSQCVRPTPDTNSSPRYDMQTSIIAVILRCVLMLCGAQA